MATASITLTVDAAKVPQIVAAYERRYGRLAGESNNALMVRAMTEELRDFVTDDIRAQQMLSAAAVDRNVAI